MAEGLARAHAPDGWRIYSAGSRPGRVSSRAVRVMQEVGIDISRHRSKGMDDVPLADADVVIRLCAEEECPVASTAGRRLDWVLPDPAAPASGDAQELTRFRQVRDMIAERLQAFWEEELAIS
ncbi:MAG: arsenate reductase ArsC [Gemmatimonadota bacterium]|nr:MAG: arsenate reductase ArsC [Gemmatimonadota bacterium]